MARPQRIVLSEVEKPNAWAGRHDCFLQAT